MISDERIKEINEKTDMVALVSEYVSLQKRGKNYFGLCPFHDDASPSFSVSPDKKIAKCMSCGEGGSPIKFLQKIKNISFEDACYELAERNGIDLPREKKNFNKKEAIDKKYYEMNELAQKFYTHFLWNSKSGQEALEYLYSRGLTKETIEEFKIGLAPKEKDLLYNVLKDKGYSDIDICDIALAKQGNSGYYDVFNNRVMFPIIDEFNHVVGFSGRIYYKSDTEPRYANSTETPVYKKGETVFNLNNAIAHIRKMKRVILCEGQMDVIALSNAGIGEVICSLGTNLTEDQAKLIAKYTKKIVICYDGDDAGIKATIKAFKLLYDFEATAVCLPDGMDPDEYLRKFGKEALSNFIKDKAIDKYEYTYMNAFRNKNLSIAYDYESVKNEVFAMLIRVRSVALQEKFLKRLSIDLKVGYDAIFSDYNIYVNKESGKSTVVVTDDIPVNKEDLVPSLEKECLALILMDYKNFLYYKRELGDLADYLTSTKSILMQTAIEFCYNNEKFNIRELYSRCCNDVKDTLFVDEIFDYLQVLSTKPVDVIDIMLSDSVKRFRSNLAKTELRSIKIETKDATDEAIAMLEKKLKIRKEISKI